MTRFLLTLMLSVFIAGPVWAQQSNEQVDGAEVAEDADLAADEAIDETDVEAKPRPTPRPRPRWRPTRRI